MNSDTEEFSPEVLHKNPFNLGEQLAASACLSCFHLSAVGNAVLDHSFCPLLVMLGYLMPCGIPAFHKQVLIRALSLSLG